ncbi:MAG TPA: hypothetical protein VH678_20690 [Xanthobacteraceae bacterium]
MTSDRRDTRDNEYTVMIPRVYVGQRNLVWLVVPDPKLTTNIRL